ncbi:hypothetical protein ACFWC2_14345 [Streptomyces diastaticus]|uniref:hypothetical protein n=1 Tax=Streptomyces diastaticus TaxID=1956 RepID=UPI003658B720
MTPEPIRDLSTQLGRWVTVTNPDQPLATWYGLLVGLAEGPRLTLALPGGGQASLPQAFTVEGAEPPPPGTPSPRRQAAYEAVYDHIHRLGPRLPTATAERNASIWRAVHAALEAAEVPALANPAEPHTTTERHPVPAGRHPVPPARDTGEDTPPETGGRTPSSPLGDTAAPSPTRTVPVAPAAVPYRPGLGDDHGDSTGDTGVRIVYTATVRRDQVHAAITEAFDLLDVQRHAQRRQP